MSQNIHSLMQNNLMDKLHPSIAILINYRHFENTYFCFPIDFFMFGVSTTLSCLLNNYCDGGNKNSTQNTLEKADI